MAQPVIVGKWSKSLLRSIIRKLLVSIFLAISIGLVFQSLLFGIDELTSPFFLPDVNLRRAIVLFIVSGIVLAGSLLLATGMFFSRLRLRKKNFPLIVLGTALGLILGSLIVSTGPGCCAINYIVALGFPSPFLTLEIALDFSPVLPIGSLQPWPLIYGQVFAYVQQNAQQHPDVIIWSGWSFFSNLIFYAHASIILLFILRGVWLLFIRPKKRK